jgi:hypothetical protein
LAGSIVMLALLLALARPYLSDALGWLELRASRAHLGREAQKHLDQGRDAADRFVELVRTGKLEQAHAEESAGFRQRQSTQVFRQWVTARPALRGPCQLTYGEIRREGNHLVSEYRYLIPPAAKKPATLRVFLVTDWGAVKVDRVLFEEPAPGF